MPPDFSFMISRYLYPVSQFQPTHVPSQESLVLNGSDAFVLITVGIKSVAESHRMFLEKYNKPLHSVNPYESYYPCLCLSSTPQFLPPTFFSGCYGNRDEITKSRRTSCPPDRLPSAFYYSYIMIPHPCSHAQYAWQDNRFPYLPASPGVPYSYAHRQSSPVHMILETYTLHNHSC